MHVLNPVKLGGLTFELNRKINQNQNNAERIFRPQLPVLNHDQFVSFKSLSAVSHNVVCNNNYPKTVVNSSSKLLTKLCEKLAPKDILPIEVRQFNTKLVARAIADECRKSARVLMDEDMYNPIKGVLNGLEDVLNNLTALGRLEPDKKNLMNTVIDLHNEFKANPIEFPKNKLFYTPNEQVDIFNFISKSDDKFDPKIFKRLTEIDDTHFAVIFKEDELHNSKLPEELLSEGYNKIARSFSQLNFTKAPEICYV